MEIVVTFFEIVMTLMLAIIAAVVTIGALTVLVCAGIGALIYLLYQKFRNK